jgi:TolB-like protein/Tfp pilus assembly protein PilF
MSAPPDIFLSYSRDDQLTARRFAEEFKRKGFSVWWDVTLRAGEAYDQVTEKALLEAKAVVVLWSKTSVASRWVRAEATQADRNKTLVPAMIEACARPIMFELTQTADLTHWRGALNDQAWLAFLADVKRFVDAERAPAQVVAPTPPTVLAPLPAKPGERGDAPSLAVLPFTNRSGLPEDEVFAIGMVEDLIDALSQGVHVRVISSAATARFRNGAIPDLDAMARQLGVRYLLEGNVRRSGASLRVTAQLTEAASGSILWAQKFDRPLSELAALQEALVMEVAANLNTQVYQVEMERALRKPGDLTAWEALMRAVAAHRTLTIARMHDCVEEARKAVIIAPDYGLAHAVLAMGMGMLYHVTSQDDTGTVQRIVEHAERALAVDPNNPLAVAYASWALSLVGRPEDGLRLGERAVRLNPGAALVHFVCGWACILLNRPDEALVHFNADVRASPGAQTNFLNFSYQGIAHICAGRWSESIAALDSSLELFPEFALALTLKAIVRKAQGYEGEGCELVRRTRRKDTAATLAIWEINFNRAFARSPKLGEILGHLRGAWADADAAT